MYGIVFKLDWLILSTTIQKTITPVPCYTGVIITYGIISFPSVCSSITGAGATLTEREDLLEYL